MQAARQALARSSSSLAPLRASSSRVRVTARLTRPSAAQADRYITIQSFFARQATHPSVSAPRTPIPQQLPRRWNSTKHDGHTPEDAGKCPKCDESNVPAHRPAGNIQEYSPFIRRLINRSSVLSKGHRPTKEDLLGAAESWWQRLRIRLKWFTIRGWRRFNTDDLSAFASWFVVGNSEF